MDHPGHNYGTGALDFRSVENAAYGARDAGFYRLYGLDRTPAAEAMDRLSLADACRQDIGDRISNHTDHCFSRCDSYEPDRDLLHLRCFLPRRFALRSAGVSRSH